MYNMAKTIPDSTKQRQRLIRDFRRRVISKVVADMRKYGDYRALGPMKQVAKYVKETLHPFTDKDRTVIPFLRGDSDRVSLGGLCPLVASFGCSIDYFFPSLKPTPQNYVGAYRDALVSLATGP
jgi:hypothetical protein